MFSLFQPDVVFDVCLNVRFCFRDEWRATQVNGRAFTNCSVWSASRCVAILIGVWCSDFEYVIEETAESAHERRRQEQLRLLRFRAFVARDTFAVFLLVRSVFVRLLTAYGTDPSDYRHFGPVRQRVRRQRQRSQSVPDLDF